MFKSLLPLIFGFFALAANSAQAGCVEEGGCVPPNIAAVIMGHGIPVGAFVQGDYLTSVTFVYQFAGLTFMCNGNSYAFQNDGMPVNFACYYATVQGGKLDLSKLPEEFMKYAN